MLYISTQRNQSVSFKRNETEIGALTVTRITSDSVTIKCFYPVTGFTEVMRLALKQEWRIREFEAFANVTVLAKEISFSNSTKAVTLGFEAPQEIRIRGTWKTRQRELANLSDAELIHHATLRGQTILEKELAARFDHHLEKTYLL